MQTAEAVSLLAEMTETFVDALLSTVRQAMTEQVMAAMREERNERAAMREERNERAAMREERKGCNERTQVHVATYRDPSARPVAPKRSRPAKVRNEESLRVPVLVSVPAPALVSVPTELRPPPDMTDAAGAVTDPDLLLAALEMAIAPVPSPPRSDPAMPPPESGVRSGVTQEATSPDASALAIPNETPVPHETQLPTPPRHSPGSDRPPQLRSGWRPRSERTAMPEVVVLRRGRLSTESA